MAVNVQPQRRGRGRTPRWSPDPDSLELLEVYRRGRLADTPLPAVTTVRTEGYYLRGMVSASIAMGGPSTLRALRDDPDSIAKVVREAPYTQRTLRGMLAAMFRLIDVTVPAPQGRLDLRNRIGDRLIPRPLANRPWNVLPATVGGSKRVQRRRPTLLPNDLRRIIKAAPLASPSSSVAVRDQALAALLCFSGVTPSEAATLRLERIQWLDAHRDLPWCAWLLGIERRRDFLCIPVAREAEPYLRALVESKKASSGYVFSSERRRQDHPLTYDMIRRVLRLAAQNAGLPPCDDLTLKRAYGTYLTDELRLTEYQIRDAFGLKTMAALDRRLGPHRRAAAQRLIISDHAPGPTATPKVEWMRLPL